MVTRSMAFARPGLNAFRRGAHRAVMSRSPGSLRPNCKTRQYGPTLRVVQQVHPPIMVRQLCSQSATEYSSAEKMKLMLLSRGGALVGVSVLALGVTKVVMSVTNFFTTINFTHVGYAGFVSGFISAGLTGAVIYLFYRVTYIRPERVFRESLRLVTGSAEVRQAMGASAFKSLKGGELRAYRIDGGRLGFSATRAVEWQNPRVQMMYQIFGDQHQAVVCAEAIKTGGSLQILFPYRKPVSVSLRAHKISNDSSLPALRSKFEVVSVDLITKDEPTLWVEGDEQIKRSADVRGSLRDFVKLKKRYVEA